MAVENIGLKGNLGTSASSDRGPSGFWSDCPVEGIRDGIVNGMLLFQDFLGFKTFSNVNAAEAYAAELFNVFGDNGAVLSDSDVVGGAITIGSDGDNEGLVVRQSIQPFQIARSLKKFWFEARIKTSTITDAKHNIFLGLMDSTAVTATVPITAAGALADVNLVGFKRPESARSTAGTGGAIMNTVYKANGVTAVTVQNDAVTLVADTFTKLGMVFEPAVDPQGSSVGDASGKYLLSFYQDGVRCSTRYQIASADGTDFPNDVRMGFVFAVLNATASTPGTSTIDWVRIAQLI